VYIACFRPADHRVESELVENFQYIDFKDLEQPAGKSCEKLCGDLLAVHLRKCMVGKTETLSHRRVMESPTCG
jgi:hypothetical protein